MTNIIYDIINIISENIPGKLIYCFVDLCQKFIADSFGGGTFRSHSTHQTSLFYSSNQFIANCNKQIYNKFIVNQIYTNVRNYLPFKIK